MKEQINILTTEYQNQITDLKKLHDQKLSISLGGVGNTILYRVLIIAACIIGIFFGKGCH